MAANTGKYPVDTATDIGKVRVLVGDTDPKNITGTEPDQTGEYLWYSDAELQSLIDVQGGGAQRIAIYVLRMVAMTPAMQLKKWSSADLSVDGAAITRALRDLIADIEKGLDGEDATEASSYFEVFSTGPAMAQPALYPDNPLEYNGKPLDPTLPWLL